MTLLLLEDVKKSYGGVSAVGGVSLSLCEGERLVLLGPNGAGKTTLFHTISGSVIATSGRIRFLGEDITRLPPNIRSRRGLARTFQVTNLLGSLTVVENISLAICGARQITFRMFRPLSGYREVRTAAMRLLVDWNLERCSESLVQNLSYGEQRQVEVVMALAGSPKLLLLDEPTAGLSPAETLHLVELVRNLPRDITLLLIEHDMDVAFQLGDRVAVMHRGQLIADGSEADIRANDQVRQIYLGQE